LAAANTDSEILAVAGLEAQFPTRHGVVHAVNGVSFAIEPGELVGLVGETGCGKSTTARSILGLLRPPGRVVAGSVRFEGEELLSATRRRLRMLRGVRIGFVPQSPWSALNPVLTVERHFANVIQAHRRDRRRDCRRQALEILQDVGIAGPERVLRSYAHQLSGGMAQRVIIALATVMRPRLLIADEPTTGLDVTIQRQILDLMSEHSRRDGRAMLIVTHDLGVVAQYCHRVVVMYAGTVVETGPAQRVLRGPAHPYTKALLGAIPRPGRKLATLPGNLPDLVDYPRGCPFHPRCEYAFELCSDVAPEIRQLDGERELNCHLERGVSESAARSA